MLPSTVTSTSQFLCVQDVVQRLESTLMHWIRQIREVVNQQDDSDLQEHAGPLAELHFWRARDLNLSGILEQLDGPGWY
jgi:dynein heavy chain